MIRSWNLNLRRTSLLKTEIDLLNTYNVVNAILNRIDFNNLFVGFHMYRFALYSSKEIIIDGKTIPYEENFRGNTSIMYEGEYIAIWNLEIDPINDMEQLAYCLVHEMFHCHQRANNETRYPSDFELLNYPDDEENFLRKYNENRYLADAYESRDITQLYKFFCIRESRFNAYPSMVRQELKAETLEGMAEYIGLKALKYINEEKYNTFVTDYLGKLRKESNLLFDVRRISYFSGAIFFLCLEIFGFSVNNDFGSEQTLYEQNTIDFKEIIPEVHSYSFVHRNYVQLVHEKESKIKEHISHAKYILSDAFICGYDPMNMFRVRDMIYCNYFVCLNESGKVKNINSAVVLKLAKGSNQDVVGYYL